MHAPGVITKARTPQPLPAPVGPPAADLARWTGADLVEVTYATTSSRGDVSQRRETYQSAGGFLPVALGAGEASLDDAIAAASTLSSRLVFERGLSEVTTAVGVLQAADGRYFLSSFEAPKSGSGHALVVDPYREGRLFSTDTVSVADARPLDPALKALVGTTTWIDLAAAPGVPQLATSTPTA